MALRACDNSSLSLRRPPADWNGLSINSDELLKQQQENHRLGVTAALGAFTIWGLAPMFFKQLVAVSPLEVIAHRILWSVPMLIGFLLLRDGPGFWRRLLLPPRLVAGLLLTGTLVGANWLVYVWAVADGQVLATSLGYFINPLFNVVLGFVFLKERLTPLQTGAVALAACGTVYMAWYLGVTPWVSLALALTFAGYGLLRKKMPVGPMVGLTWETLLLSAPALGYLLWLRHSEQLWFTHSTVLIDTLLVLSALITVLPLVWFNLAAKHLRLTTIGFIQYMAPSLTFILAVAVYDETFTFGHAVAFGCIWSALLLITMESLVRSRRARARAARAAAPPVP